MESGTEGCPEGAEAQLHEKETPQSHFIQGDLDFDFHNLRFFKGGRPLEFSVTEQKILKVLCEDQINVKKQDVNTGILLFYNPLLRSWGVAIQSWASSEAD